MLPSGIVVLQKIVPSFRVLERSAFNKFAFVKFTFFKLDPCKFVDIKLVSEKSALLKLEKLKFALI